MRKYLPMIVLCGCLQLPENGDVEDATVFHWENEHATMEKFISDHKGCLGIKKQTQKNRMQGLLSPMEPDNIPQWDNLWATFESRGYRETGQRIAFSLPSGEAPLMHNYQSCMEGIGYKITYRR
jgi:hypothetical protein